MDAGHLDAAILAAGVPRGAFDGVSIGRKDDRRTWRIDFAPAAGAPERAAAQAALDAFDPAGVSDPPRRDLAAELDAVKAKVAAAEAEIAALKGAR